MKIASFFAGVGGIDIAFSKLGDVVYVNELDKYAVKTYESNFNIKVDNRDIRAVDTSEIPDFDIMIGGFPCQAFSIAGLRQGFEDEKGRGSLFFELERIFKVKQPSIIFLENVKNLVSFSGGSCFEKIIESLTQNGYHVHYKILNTMDYGNIPQNRERVYIVAFKDKNKFNSFTFPNTTPLTKTLADVIEFNEKVDDKYYYTKENFQHYDALIESVTSTDTVYQWRRSYVRENKSNVCPTLTAAMGTGGNNVPIIKTLYGIRKLTPRECFNLQGFPQSFILPSDVSNSQLYKQSGNSVSVTTIIRIVDEILKTL